MPLDSSSSLNTVASKLGFVTGTYKGWSYIAKSEEGIPKLVDRAAVALSSQSADDTNFLGAGHEVVLYGDVRCQLYIGVFKPSLKNMFSKKGAAPCRAFRGILSLKSLQLPIVPAYAYIERGGVFQRHETLLAMIVERDCISVPELVATIADRPFQSVSRTFIAIGKAIAAIHSKGVTAGIEHPKQILVKDKSDSVEAKIIVGPNYQIESALFEQRQLEDLVGANFVFHHSIAPTHRMRMLSAYCTARGMTSEQMKNMIASVADMTRLRALKEWKVYPSDLPKKTSYLNLIRALDRHSE